ncbi:MAG: TatD family hydrolase [Spirochaetaceae bacterium]|jgi:TatD DNase family protein|nr:TatD family hydrolase [Spirochaetaceae bacterium]
MTNFPTDNFELNTGCNGLFDTHAHLSYLDARGIDAENCVSGLFKSGFAGIIDIGTIAGDLAERVHTFSHFEQVHFSAGIWPHKDILAQTKQQIDTLEQNINTAPAGSVVAIGECGFDRRENPDNNPAERALLEAQLDLARRRQLPIIIHSREAPAETIETLASHPGAHGIIHCFSYNTREARAFLDMGYYISFAGNITFKNAGSLREALQSVPLDRLLLETDSPYLAPAPYRGKPAHPGMIIQTYRCAAELLKIDIEELKETVKRNAARVFGLSFNLN